MQHQLLFIAVISYYLRYFCVQSRYLRKKIILKAYHSSFVWKEKDLFSSLSLFYLFFLPSKDRSLEEFLWGPVLWVILNSISWIFPEVAAQLKLFIGNAKEESLAALQGGIPFSFLALPYHVLCFSLFSYKIFPFVFSGIIRCWRW